MNAAPLVFDLETIGTESAMALPWPETEWTPPSNIKDPLKIEERRERAKAEWAADRAKTCALNPRLGRIVCVGTGIVGTEATAIYAKTEAHEAALLRDTWEQIAAASGIITFNGLSFDVPFFLYRSAVHSIKPTVPLRTVFDWGRRYVRAPHYDIRAVLSQWDSRASGTLSDHCTAFGIPCPTGSGPEVYAHYQAGEFDKIAEHCRSDVEATAKLYQRISPIFGECQ